MDAQLVNRLRQELYDLTVFLGQISSSDPRGKEIRSRCAAIRKEVDALELGEATDTSAMAASS